MHPICSSQEDHVGANQSTCLFRDGLIGSSLLEVAPLLQWARARLHGLLCNLGCAAQPRGGERGMATPSCPTQVDKLGLGAMRCAPRKTTKEQARADTPLALQQASAQETQNQSSSCGT